MPLICCLSSCYVWLAFIASIIAHSCPTSPTMTLENIFCRAAIQSDSSQPLLLHEVIPSQVQGFVLVFIQPHDFPFGSFLSFGSLWVIALPSSVPAAFSSLVSSMRLLTSLKLLIMLDILPQYWLNEHSHNWPPAVLQTIEYNPSSPTVQQFFPPPLCPFI